MNAPFRLPEATDAASPTSADRFAFAILKDGAWTALGFFPTKAAAWRAYDCGQFDDAMHAAYPFDRYDVREIIPTSPAAAALPPGDIEIDINIPDWMVEVYPGVDIITLGQINAEHRAAADAAFDNRPDRMLLAEGD